MAPEERAVFEAGGAFGEEMGIEGLERARAIVPETLPTGISALDQALEGGLVSGILSEFVSVSPSSGGQTVLLHLLESMRRRRKFAALVDGSDAFDPQSAPLGTLEHLLWARCRSVEQAMQVADVLLRDENLGLVLLDMRGCSERELRRVKSTAWYRLQRLAGKSGSVACVFTEEPRVPSAQTRILLEGQLGLERSECSLRALGEALRFRAVRLRRPRQADFPLLVERSRRTG